jgi:DnaJ family protein C protein 11
MQVGLAGIHAKVRYSRGSQTYEFPIMLSNDYTDWKLLVGTTLLPPLASLVVMRFIVRPLVRRHRAAAEAKAREEAAQELHSRLKRAAAEAALLEPVAIRKAATEAAKEGLVILEAAYGDVGAFKGARAAKLAQQQQQEQQQQQGGLIPNGTGHKAEGRDAGATGGLDQGTRADGSTAAAADVGAGASSEATTSSSSRSQLEVPRWVDVTHALQYLVASSKLELHPGVSKSGLMGFADVLLQGERELYVAFSFRGQVLERVVGDMDLLRLPEAGHPVDETEVREWHQKLLKERCQVP